MKENVKNLNWRTRKAKHSKEDEKGVVVVVVLVNKLFLDAALEDTEQEINEQLISLLPATCKWPAASRSLPSNGDKRASNPQKK